MHWQTIARRQHGVITRRQLVACGETDWAIARLIRDGHLVTDRVQGVYVSGAIVPTAMTQAWSAVLASRAVLSHQTAAVHWGIDVPHGALVHVTAPGRRRTRPPDGVRIHRVALRDEDTVRRWGLDVTARPRTVLDCLGVLSEGQAATLFDRALQRRWLTVDDIVRRLVLERGRWGNRRIRRLAAAALVGDSELERMFHTLLRQAGITGWQANVPLQAGRAVITVDVVFRAERVVIELDGLAHHVDTERFQADRSRQNALVGDGWTVLRFTWRDLVERPDGVVAQVRTHLARAAA